MSWQDVVLTICQIFFIFSLFPSIFSKDKPPVSTSAINALCLYIVSFVDFTLNLWGAGFATLVVGILWTILAIQKYSLDQKKRS